MSDLKTCPFCGGRPIWEYCTEDRLDICCDTCGITFEEGFRNRKDAIEAWNRRAIDLGITNRNDHFLDATKMIPERTAKVEAQYQVGDHGKIYEYGSCGACGAPVIKPDKYCSECGARLDWSE